MTMRFSVLSGRVRRPREGTVMNIEKYTERSRGFIQSAQTLATREGHHLMLRGCGPAVRRMLHLSRLSRFVEVERAAATA